LKFWPTKTWPKLIRTIVKWLAFRQTEHCNSSWFYHASSSYKLCMHYLIHSSANDHALTLPLTLPYESLRNCEDFLAFVSP
jgi:hypothetical protein